MHADDREAASLLRAQAISGKSKPRLNERRYVRKDGGTIWAQIAGGVVRDSAGTPVYTSAMISDITALKRAARTSEQRFRRMVEMSSDWYWMQDERVPLRRRAGARAARRRTPTSSSARRAGR